MKIKILRYFSLLITSIVLILLIIFFSAMLGLKGILGISVLVFLILSIFIVRYFSMGVFSATEIENNRLKIKWIRKPLFSKETDFEIDLSDIKEVKLFNDFLSHTPDEFYLLTYSGKSLTFHVPIFSFKNDFCRFHGILQSGRYIQKENMKNKRVTTRNKKHRAESAKFERHNI